MTRIGAYPILHSLPIIFVSGIHGMPRRTGTRSSLYQEHPGDARPALDGATATAISDSDGKTDTGSTGIADRDSETDTGAIAISDSDSGSRHRCRPATRRETICRDAGFPKKWATLPPVSNGGRGHLPHLIRFSAIVHDKLAILAYVRRHNETDPAYHYRPNELYDFMVRRLFKERLHKQSAHRVCFARRGRADRTEALGRALDIARRRFAGQQGIAVNAAIEVVPVSPIQEGALQAVDYFLWALQRTFEKHEDRFLRLLWPQCSLVIDADDSREKEYGRYYTQQRPLTAAALKQAEGYRSQPPR